MYLRTTKVKRPDGHVDEYIRLVESYWNNGRPRHRIVCHLGRKELLAPHAEALLRLLKGESQPKAKIQAEAVGAWDWGPCWWLVTSGRTGIASHHRCLGPQQRGSGRVRRPGLGAGQQPFV